MKSSANFSLVPHHDGSELYVSDIAPKIGDQLILRVRIPATYLFEQGFVRVYEDAEPRTYRLKKGKKQSTESWYEVTIPILNIHTIYRFVFIGPGKYEWLNAYGLTDHDVHSNNDFQIVSTPSNPEWIHRSVFYQIFPDRFARSGRVNITPEWAHPRGWNELPRGRSRYTGTELYGGDLYGVTEHLNHIEDLGVNGIYFTPMFPSRSNHRYDAIDFNHVDPVLGGDKALLSLLKEAKGKGIKILGDLSRSKVQRAHLLLLG
jgi:alpha-glucosidase